MNKRYGRIVDSNRYFEEVGEIDRSIGMTFEKTVTLKDGRNCLLRNGVTSDGKAVLDVFNRDS